MMRRWGVILFVVALCLATPGMGQPSARSASPTVSNAPIASTAPTTPAHDEAISEKCVAGFWGLCISNKIDLAIFVPIIVGVAGYLYSEALKWKEKRDYNRKLLVALRVEIDLNLKGLYTSIMSFPDFASYTAFLARGRRNRPISVSVYTTDVYNSAVSSLSSLPSSLIDGIVSFYSELEHLKAMAHAIDRPGYPSISIQGKQRLHLDTAEKLKVAVEKGEGVKRQLALILPSKL